MVLQIKNALVVILLLAAIVPAAAEDWPDKMTAEEIAAHKPTPHDGYVLRALPLQAAPVEQSAKLAPSQSTLDYLAGYSPKLGQWTPLPDGKLDRRNTFVGIRATLRAVQSGGENWQLVMTSPQGKVKRLSPVSYQRMGPNGQADCFGDYITQNQRCQSRTAQVLWLVEAKCFQPGAWSFSLQDQPAGEHGVGEMRLTVPGKPKQGAADPCEVKPTPVSEHDKDPEEIAFQRLAQREMMFARFSRPAPQAAPLPRSSAVALPASNGSENNTSLAIQLVSGGGMLLIDPKTRKTGFDSAEGKEIEQIPDSFYARAQPPPNLANDPHGAPLRVISVSQPETGNYLLRVGATQGAPFFLSISASMEGRSLTLLQTDPHVSSEIEYRIKFNSSDLKQMRVLGGFDANPRPRDRDPLLTFASPTKLRTELPAGAKQTEILAFYAPGIKPESLRAKLNRKDVSSLFHPYAGWREMVSVPLEPGENVLEIAIKGTVNRKGASDQTRLTFAVAK